jgi:hypothetical protein
MDHEPGWRVLVEVENVFTTCHTPFPVNSVMAEGTSFEMLLFGTHITQHRNKVLCHAIVLIWNI